VDGGSLRRPYGAVLQQQVGHHWQPLGFYSKKLSKTEVNYSHLRQGAARHCLRCKTLPLPPRGQTFQLWTNHKPLIFVLNNRVVTTDVLPPPTTPGVHIRVHQQPRFNVVADVLSRPDSGIRMAALCCATVAEKAPFNLKDMAASRKQIVSRWPPAGCKNWMCWPPVAYKLYPSGCQSPANSTQVAAS
jgi:hypothetical protein